MSDTDRVTSVASNAKQGAPSSADAVKALGAEIERRRSRSVGDLERRLARLDEERKRTQASLRAEKARVRRAEKAARERADRKLAGALVRELRALGLADEEIAAVPAVVSEARSRELREGVTLWERLISMSGSRGGSGAVSVSETAPEGASPAPVPGPGSATESVPERYAEGTDGDER